MYFSIIKICFTYVKTAMNLGSWMDFDTSVSEYQNSYHNDSSFSFHPPPPAPVTLYNRNLGIEQCGSHGQISGQGQHTRVNLLQSSIRQPSKARRLISCQHTHENAIMMTCLMGHDKSSWSCTLVLFTASEG